MNFTFGIITGGGADTNLNVIIDSIRAQEIPNYEIIIVGATKVQGPDIIVIPFDESQRHVWITKKKNIIAQQACYNNIVMLHDYVTFDKDWYRGFLEFGKDFKMCINKIKTQEGLRFRDYTVFGNDMPPPFCHRSLIPYDAPNEIKTLLAPLTYVSGSYYVIKKYIALKYPLNEKLLWCQGEDLELTLRLRKDNIYPILNPNSTVHFLKEKSHALWETELTKTDIETLSESSVKNLQVFQESQIYRNISKYL
jgi:hypothetical protein